MPKKDIDFRELIERVLPLDALPAADRLHVQRAIRTGVAEQIEQAALMALVELERHGALKRIPAPGNGRSGIVRFQPAGRLDIITLELPAPREAEGLVRYPRNTLPAQAKAALYQVRRLLRLDDHLFSSDPRTGDPRAALISQLDPLGQELLGALELRFVGLGGENGIPGQEPISERLLAEARNSPHAVLYCPDTARCPDLRDEALRLGVRSVALAAVAPAVGAPLGVLEVRATEPDAYRPEQLALVQLVADCCATALERVARIQQLVFVDPLTGSYNRAYFDLQVHNEMARAQRERASMALCIVDIDDFKAFNTTFGYEAGNQVLIEVAETLRRAVRPFDTVSRWGGEEFAVLLTPPVHLDDVEAVCERLRSQVERQLVRIEGLDGSVHRVAVTVSIGVAVYPEHQQSAQDLWRAANQALLVAKRPPKNQVVFYTPEA